MLAGPKAYLKPDPAQPVEPGIHAPSPPIVTLVTDPEYDATRGTFFVVVQLLSGDLLTVAVERLNMLRQAGGNLVE